MNFGEEEGEQNQWESAYLSSQGHIIIKVFHKQIPLKLYGLVNLTFFTHQQKG